MVHVWALRLLAEMTLADDEDEATRALPQLEHIVHEKPTHTGHHRDTTTHANAPCAEHTQQQRARGAVATCTAGCMDRAGRCATIHWQVWL
jgi:hypothetical protein